MKKQDWLRGLAATGLGFAMLATDSTAQQPAAPAQQPAAPAGGQPPPQPHAPALLGHQGNAAKPGVAADLPGPIDTPRDVQDTAKLLFMIADTNHDGQISKKEATDAGDLLVGGLFFRADTNGDGKVTQEEARTIREEILKQNPVLRLALQQTRKQPGGNPATNPDTVLQTVAGLLDTNNDKQLTAPELRKAVETVVDTLYGVADTNRDGQMSAAEINAAALAMGRDAGRLAFRLADTDGNGSVSKDEFEKAIVEPARVVFGVIDSNNDGQISADEAQRWQTYIVQRLQAAAPKGSDQIGPLPDFLGASPQPRQGAAPARTQPAPANPPGQ